MRSGQHGLTWVAVELDAMLGSGTGSWCWVRVQGACNTARMVFSLVMERRLVLDGCMTGQGVAFEVLD
jgi:hypothetical protein